MAFTSTDTSSASTQARAFSARERPVAQERVLLLGQAKTGQVLVAADVEGADDDRARWRGKQVGVANGATGMTRRPPLTIAEQATLGNTVQVVDTNDMVVGIQEVALMLD